MPEVLDALGPLLDRPGAFVLGSNDYFAPGLKNPLRYLTGGTGDDVRPQDRRQDPDLPWRDLVAVMSDAGLGRPRQRLGAGSRSTAARSRCAAWTTRTSGATATTGSPDPPRRDADLALGVVHAPYHRVLDRMAADGLPLVLAGHTHGGQLCVPFCGALVTNCDLTRAGPRACRGTRTTTWLHVSAGWAPRRTPRSGSPARPRRPC